MNCQWRKYEVIKGMKQMALNRVKTILYTVVAKNSPHKGRNIRHYTD
jgi:hypothetical protein